jgi:hypothetical protein
MKSDRLPVSELVQIPVVVKAVRSLEISLEPSTRNILRSLPSAAGLDGGAVGRRAVADSGSDARGLRSCWHGEGIGKLKDKSD